VRLHPGILFAEFKKEVSELEKVSYRELILRNSIKSLEMG
jgi:hypothetical protein